MHMISIKRGTQLIGASLAGLLTLIMATTNADAAPRVTGDCAHVAKADQPLCAVVRTQHAYGWTDDVGNPQNWMGNGRALVHEITHQGYSKGEMHDALKGAHRDYRDNVTDVSFNLDTLVRTCGHHHGAYAVQTIRGTDGHDYTWKQTICD